MAYRYDNDLEFLRTCSDSELDILVQMLTKTKDGETRLNESITNTEQYKLHNPRHSLYWELIAEEVQRFGANSIVTIFRGGKGVLYREILIDVCKKMKVNFNDKSSCEVIEQNLLLKILTDSLEKMTPEQLQEIVTDLDLKTTNFTKEAVIAALQTSVRVGGFAVYQTALIVANAVAKMVLGRGLAFATNAGLTRAIGVFAGPIGWAVTAAWTIADLAGPAFRITIPSVIQIAFLRAQKNITQY